MNRIFVNRQLVIHTLFVPFFMLLPIFALMAIFGNIGLALLCFTIQYLFILSVMLIFRHNAFRRIEISEQGIRNSHVSFTWQELDELNDYRIYRVILYKYNLLKPFVLPSIIGIGQNEKSDFHFLNYKKTVLFSLDKKTFSLLKRYGEGSVFVQGLLQKYSPT